MRMAEQYAMSFDDDSAIGLNGGRLVIMMEGTPGSQSRNKVDYLACGMRLSVRDYRVLDPRQNHKEGVFRETNKSFA